MTSELRADYALRITHYSSLITHHAIRNTFHVSRITAASASNAAGFSSAEVSPSGGEMLRRCPSCDAPFSSVADVECESCGATLRENELFGSRIRRA